VMQMNFDVVLNTLHMALNGTGKNFLFNSLPNFRGRMRQYMRKVLPVDASDESRRTLSETEEYREQVKELPFLSLALDLPPAPLYLDERMQNIIPQVPLAQLLTKFNGVTEKEYKTYKDNFIKRFELLHLPEYLIITYDRFHKNQCNVDFYDSLAEDVRDKHKYTTYDLISNVVHDGKPQTQANKGDIAVDIGRYRVQLVHEGTSKWFELEDLHVKEILPQTITLAESYIQIWRLNRKKTRTERMGETEEEIKADTLWKQQSTKNEKGENLMKTEKNGMEI
uniref:ubiquitinyl hydrolase 1 n=1 Tax=Meloidogyne incognita TaxID=6306 RepID=A0A914LJW5_MELIC